MDVHPVHDAVLYRRATLNDPPAHASYVLTAAAVGNGYVVPQGPRMRRCPRLYWCEPIT